MKHKTKYVPYEKQVTINEYKAPTDESLKLLNEMQEKAQRNILQSIKIETNSLKAMVIYYQDDVITDRIIFYLKFELNGKEYIVKDCVNKYDWNQSINSYYGLRSEYVFKLLHKKFSEAITEEIMKQCSDFLSKI